MIKRWMLTIVVAFLAVAWTAPQAAMAADGFDPACDAPENWQEDFNVRQLMEHGYPAWFEDCHPGMPPIWPTDVELPLTAATGRGAAPAGVNTSAPGTLWDSQVADPLNNIATNSLNMVNFGGFTDADNFRTVDDFFLDPALLTAPGCQFEITEIRSSEAQASAANPPLNTFVLEIWNHDPVLGRPAGITAADRAAGPFNHDSASFIGIDTFNNFSNFELTWNFGAPLVLAPGTYWLSASADANGTTSVDQSTYLYNVPSGSFGVSQCYRCTGLPANPWTAPNVRYSLDFDIDGQVVCPQAAPVGGFGVGDVETVVVTAAVKSNAQLPLAWLVLALGFAIVGSVIWMRRT